MPNGRLLPRLPRVGGHKAQEWRGKEAFLAQAGAAWHGGGDGGAASSSNSLAVSLLPPRWSPQRWRGGGRAGGALTRCQPPRCAAAAGRYLLLSAGELP